LKKIFAFLAITVAFFISGCEFFGTTGEVRDQQSRKTVFRSADESQIDNPTVTLAPQRVPGE
jgi:hypothetical protein